jgi:probable HAF family extracellular repeat protein
MAIFAIPQGCTITDLSAHPSGPISVGLGIDATGAAVGSTGTDTHAFLYDGSMFNLNNLIPAGSGWELVEATALNDAGQIVGYGRFNDHTRAFLLTPARG